eukprot:c21993_g1_i3.p1 GENE.c21993_g1_i3~~c21993_g1_i3.p1  ORF type:complete len:511 (-),score=112.45 c21993_g1_i3:97-1593(-)
MVKIMIGIRNYCFVVFFICLFFGVCSNLQIHSPSHLTKYVNSPVTSKYFGPQKFDPINATVIYFTGDYCKEIRQKDKIGGIEIGNYSGYIVIIKAISDCLADRIYKNLDETTPVGIVLAANVYVPGFAYYLSTGNREETSSRKTPMITVYKNNIADLITYLNQPDYKFDVVIEIYPDKNYWIELFTSFPYFLVMRVFFPLLFFPTFIFSSYLLWETYHIKRTTMTRTKGLVFSIEAIVMFLNGFSLAANGILGNDFFTSESIWFFYSGFPGLEMFTTVLVAMFYYSLNRANRTLTEVVDIFLTRKSIIIFLFIIFLFLDVIGGILSFSGINVVVVISAVALCVSVMNLLVGIFLVREKLKFVRYSNSKAKKNNTSPYAVAIFAICAHTGKWLIPSVFFMALSIVSSILMIFTFFWIPNVFFSVASMLYLSRWGIVFSQLMALKWKYEPKHQNSMYVKSMSFAIWTPQKRSPVIPHASQSQQIYHSESLSLSKTKHVEK